MGYLRIYTGEVCEPHVPRALADSVYMAYTGQDGKEHVLNQGFGMLYAEADIRPDNTIAPRGVRNPRGLVLEEGYGILAEPVDPEGEPAGEECLILWRTRDFLRFRQETVERGRWQTAYDQARDRVELPDSLWEGIRQRWCASEPELRKVEFPLAVGWADPVIFDWEGKW